MSASYLEIHASTSASFFTFFFRSASSDSLFSAFLADSSAVSRASSSRSALSRD